MSKSPSEQKEQSNQELAANVYNMLETMEPSEQDKLLSTISLGGKLGDKKRDSAVQEVYKSVLEEYINDQVENQLKNPSQQLESLQNVTGTEEDLDSTRRKQIRAELMKNPRFQILDKS